MTKKGPRRLTRFGKICHWSFVIHSSFGFRYWTLSPHFNSSPAEVEMIYWGDGGIHYSSAGFQTCCIADFQVGTTARCRPSWRLGSNGGFVGGQNGRGGGIIPAWRKNQLMKRGVRRER